MVFGLSETNQMNKTSQIDPTAQTYMQDCLLSAQVTLICLQVQPPGLEPEQVWR